MSDMPPKPPLPAEAIAALQQGRMIEAIKIIRQVHGLSLLEAKQWAETVQREITPSEAPKPLMHTKPFAIFLTPFAFSFGALGLLFQANAFLQAESNTAYCATAHRGRYLICQLSAELGEQYFGAGKGYVGSAMFLLLLGGLVGLLAWVSYRAIQKSRNP